MWRVARPESVCNSLELSDGLRQIVRRAASLVLDTLGSHRTLQLGLIVESLSNIPPSHTMGMCPYIETKQKEYAQKPRRFEIGIDRVLSSARVLITVH